MRQRSVSLSSGSQTAVASASTPVESTQEESTLPTRLLHFGYNTYAGSRMLLNYGYETIQGVIEWPSNFYGLKQNREEFILKKMYERATKDKNVTYVTVFPQAVSWAVTKFFGVSVEHCPYRIYVIAGPENVPTVGDFGEHKDQQDPIARHPTHFLGDITGIPNFFIAQQGEKARNVKTVISKSLNKFEMVAEISRTKFHALMASWDPKRSYQDQMVQMVASIIGKILFNLEAVPDAYIPGLREVGKVFLDPDQKPERIKQCAEFVSTMNRELLSANENKREEKDEHPKGIIDSVTQALEDSSSDNFLLQDLDLAILDAETDPHVKEQLKTKSFKSNYLREKREELKNNPQLLKQRLTERSGIAYLTTESNVSMAAMGIIYYLNHPEHSEIRICLAQEVAECRKRYKLAETDPLPREAYRELFYLDCIYWEVLRILSTIPLLLRLTSKPANMEFVDPQGTPKTHSIPRNCMLFSPLRSIHHDAGIWRDPLTFNPSRFDPRDQNGSVNSIDSDQEDGNQDFFSEEKNETFTPLNPDQQKAAKALREKVNPFSRGIRRCPARDGFVEYLIKIIAVECLAYSIRLNKEIPLVPTAKFETFWPEDFTAQVEKMVNAAASEVAEAHQQSHFRMRTST